MDLRVLLSNPLIAQNVFQYTPAATLHSLTLVSRATKKLVERHYAHKFRCLCGQYLDRVDEFLRMLGRCKGCITGSAALEVIMNDCEASWQAGDLDVSVPKEQSCRLCLYLEQKEGYVREDTADGDSTSHQRAGYEQLIKHKKLRSVCKLRSPKTGRRIDVLESTDESCISPLCDFHSTAVVNALFPDRITCYFPAHTLRYRAIRNVAHQSHKDRRAVSKYTGRGEGVFRPFAHRRRASADPRWERLPACPVHDHPARGRDPRVKLLEYRCVCGRSHSE